VFGCVAWKRRPFRCGCIGAIIEHTLHTIEKCLLDDTQFRIKFADNPIADRVIFELPLPVFLDELNAPVNPRADVA